mmetsp:Transcript_14580/g.27331  ORF Transcript_14580/g.27331 Transcript_14580/m.27331 type:complete len:251 (-) Transcript_14580:170-922(-)
MSSWGLKSQRVCGSTGCSGSTVRARLRVALDPLQGPAQGDHELQSEAQHTSQGSLCRKSPAQKPGVVRDLDRVPAPQVTEQSCQGSQSLKHSSESSELLLSHAFKLHSSSSLAAQLEEPPCSSRLRTPPPQLRLQVLQDVHAQGGQDSSSKLSPPQCTAPSLALARCRRPPSQSDQVPQSVQHVKQLAYCSEGPSHGSPPGVWAMATRLPRRLLPSPPVVLQGDHAAQSDQLQSTPPGLTEAEVECAERT